MSRVTLKTSTIFIAVDGKTRVYRSVEEIPAPLRKRLEQSTNGANSATILIADRRGRQEIARAIRGLPAAVRSPLAKGHPAGEPLPHESALVRTTQFLRESWLELLLPPVLGAIVWAAFKYL